MTVGLRCTDGSIITLMITDSLDDEEEKEELVKWFSALVCICRLPESLSTNRCIRTFCFFLLMSKFCRLFEYLPSLFDPSFSCIDYYSFFLFHVFRTCLSVGLWIGLCL